MQLFVKNKMLINNHYYPVEIIHMKRKTLSLQWKQDKIILVKAPQFISDKEIYCFLDDKALWLEKQLLRLEKKQAATLPFRLMQGEQIPLYGELHTLVILTTLMEGRETIQKSGQELVIHVSDESEGNIRELFGYWCKKACKPLFESLTSNYANKMQVDYNRIVLKEQKTCWGSCSGKKNLNFNWKLILMPKSVMDYVVVHELAHLKQMNHSKQFWEEVEKVIPHYKKERKWLKENGYLYTIF